MLLRATTTEYLGLQKENTFRFTNFLIYATENLLMYQLLHDSLQKTELDDRESQKKSKRTGKLLLCKMDTVEG